MSGWSIYYLFICSHLPIEECKGSVYSIGMTMGLPDLSLSVAPYYS